MTWTSKICKRFLYLYALIKFVSHSCASELKICFFLKEGVFLPFTSMILCKGQCQLSNKHLFSQEQNCAAQREKSINCEGCGQPAHLSSLVRAFAVRPHKIGTRQRENISQRETCLALLSGWAWDI